MSQRTVPSSGIYTAILALALLAVLFASSVVAYKCSADYKTVFKVSGQSARR